MVDSLESEVSDENFFEASSCLLLSGVEEFNSLDREIAEDFTDLWHVVEREHELSLESLETARKRDEICRLQVVAIQLFVVIRRIEVKERTSAVVPLENLFVGQPLDLHTHKSGMGCFELLGKAFEIESRWLGDVSAVIFPAHEPAVAGLLKVQIPRCSLNVRKRSGIGFLEEIKLVAADERELEMSDEFLVMPLAYAVEVDDLAVEIIQDFNLGRFLVKEDLRSSGKGLDVRSVLREYLNDLLGEPVLAPDVAERSSHSMDEIYFASLDRG